MSFWDPGEEERAASLSAQVAGLDPNYDYPPVPAAGLFERYVTQPVSSAFGFTQNLVPRVLFGQTEAYRQAEEELGRETGAPGSWRAAPGLGDVAVAALEAPGWVETPLRLVGNIAADPTTWLPGAALGRATKLGTRGVEAARLAGKLTPEIETGLKAAEAATRIQATKAALELANPAWARSYDMLTKAGLGSNVGLAAVAGLAFSPGLARGAAEGAKAAYEQLQQGDYGEALASGGTAALMAGLLALTTRGAIHSIDAARILRQSLAEKAPAAFPAEPVPLPEAVPAGVGRTIEEELAARERAAVPTPVSEPAVTPAPAAEILNRPVLPTAPPAPVAPIPVTLPTGVEAPQPSPVRIAPEIPKPAPAQPEVAAPAPQATEGAITIAAGQGPNKPTRKPSEWVSDRVYRDRPDVKERVDKQIEALVAAGYKDPGDLSANRLRELVPDEVIKDPTTGEAIKGRAGKELTLRAVVKRVWEGKAKAAREAEAAAAPAPDLEAQLRASIAANEAKAAEAAKVPPPAGAPGQTVAEVLQAQEKTAAEGGRVRPPEPVPGVAPVETRGQRLRLKAEELQPKMESIKEALARLQREKGTTIGGHIVPAFNLDELNLLGQYTGLWFEQKGLKAGAKISDWADYVAHMVEQFGEKVRPFLPRMFEKSGVPFLAHSPTPEETQAITRFQQEVGARRVRGGAKGAEFVGPTVERALTVPEWRALQTEEERVLGLHKILAGQARGEETRRSRAFSRELSIAQYAQEEKEAGRKAPQLSTEMERPGVVRPGESEEAAREVERKAVLQRKAEWVQGVAESRMGRTDESPGAAEDVMLSLLRELPDSKILGEGLSESEGGRALLRGTAHANRFKLNLLHQILRRGENADTALVRRWAEGNGWSPGTVAKEFSSEVVSKLKRVYDNIFSGKEWQPPEKVELPSEAVEAAGAAVSKRSPEAWSGLKTGEVAQRIEFVGSGRGIGARGEEGTRVRIHGPGGKGELAGRGVWIDVARTDTPNVRVTTGEAPVLEWKAGAPGNLTPEEHLKSQIEDILAKRDEWLQTVRTKEASSIRIDTSKGHDPEGVAALLEDLISSNPNLARITMPAGANRILRQAMRILEEKGLLNQKLARAAEVVPVEAAITKPLVPGRPPGPMRHAPEIGPEAPGVPRDLAGEGTRERAWTAAESAQRAEELNRVRELRAEARKIREYTAGQRLPALPGEPPIVSTYKEIGGKPLRDPVQLEKEADAIYAKWGRAPKVLAQAEAAVPTVVAEKMRRPTELVWDLVGRKSPVERIVANSSMVPDDLLSHDQLVLKEAHFLDASDAAQAVGGVKVVDADGAWNGDREVLDRFARAHAAINPVLEATLGRVSKLLGVETEHGGVLVSPFTNASVVMEAGKPGRVFPNPSMSLYKAAGEGTGTRGAAEDLVFSQIVHELDHLLRGTPGHDPESMAKAVELVKKAAAEEPGLVEELAKPELWKGLQDAQAEFSRKMEDMYGGRVRESWRRAEGGVGELRPGAPEGGAPGLPNRPLEAQAGAEAGGGPGVRPGAPIPEGAGGEAGGVGGAAPGGGGGGRIGGGGPPGPVPGGGEEGRGEGPGRRVAFGAEPGWDELNERLKNFGEWKAPREQLQGEAMMTAGQLTRHLMARVAAGEKGAAEEFGRRMAAKPSGKGLDWSRINANWRDIPDDLKVKLSYFSQLTRENPELSRYYAADRAVHFEDLHPDALAWVQDHGPEEFDRKIRSGKKLNLLDVDIQRILGTDLLMQQHEAERQWLEAIAAGRPAETIAGLAEELAVANGRLDMLPRFTNATQSEVARMLAFHKWMVEASDPQTQKVHQLTEYLRRMLQPRYTDKNELNQVVGTLMKRYGELRNEAGWVDHGQAEWTDAVQKAFKFGKLDWVLEAYKGGLLGWTSRIANLGSNAAYAGWRQGEKALAAAIDKAWKGEGAERVLDEALIGKRVMRRGFAGASKGWIRAQKDALALRPEAMTALNVSNELMSDFIHMPGVIRGKLGEFLRYQFKGLNADDAFFKHLSKIDSYYREAVRAVKKGMIGWEKRPGEDLWDAVERYVDDMEKSVDSFQTSAKPLPEKYKAIYERATSTAQYETFQKQLGPAASAIQRGLHEGAGRGLQFVVPFFRTPLNIAKAAVERTPLNWAKLAVEWKGMDHAQRVDALARHAMSTAVAAGLYALVEGSGLELSGNGPIDPEANQLMKESGWAPYSIKMGDKWYSYQRFEPLASLLGMFADAMEGMKAGDFEKWGTGLQRAAGTITQNITSKTFLTGLENVTNMVSDPQRFGQQFIKQQLAGIVPNTLGYVPVGHLARQIDPVYREVGIGPDIILNKLPWLSKTLPPQYAPTGEERVRPGTLGPRVISPVQVTTEKKTPEARAARMLAEVGFPMRRVTSQFPYKGVKVEITREEQKALAQAQAKALAFIGARLMNDPNFQALPGSEDEAQYPGQRTKRDVLSRIVRRFREPVVSRMNPELRARAAQLLRKRSGERELGAGA